ncbi:hypothetical protein BB560_002796 [Smittium megazygosporum]|uniref:Small ribosomal subunit protein mS29 n=1 Tax=Smittium megazygosporum TaxID=133381 RepID=A0A2T9ZDT4_9FUNG|nr:hypothetical protein BB560_002796 [Smittium megazygosporum]
MSFRHFVPTISSRASLAFRGIYGPQVRAISSAQILQMAKAKPKTTQKRGADKTKSTSFKKKIKGLGSEVFSYRLNAGEDESDVTEQDFRNSEYYKSPPHLDINPIKFEYLVQNFPTKIFSIDENLIQVFQASKLSGKLNQVFDILNNTGLVARGITNNVAERVMKSSITSYENTIILDGECGVGKTASLLQIASCAIKSDWFVFYVPETISWVDSSKPYIPSFEDPSKFYQWTLVSSLLNNINLINNNDILHEKLLLKEECTLGKNKFAVGTPISSVIDVGIKTPSLSQQALQIVLDCVSSQTEVPVLIAIDQINTFFSLSSYTDQENKRIYSNKLLLVESLLPYFGNLTTLSEYSAAIPKKKLQRGVVIGATSKADKRFRDYYFFDYLRNRKSTTHPFEVLNVPVFTKEEAFYLLGLYKLSNLTNIEPSLVQASRIWGIASGVPSKIYDYCSRFF